MRLLAASFHDIEAAPPAPAAVDTHKHGARHIDGKHDLCGLEPLLRCGCLANGLGAWVKEREQRLSDVGLDRRVHDSGPSVDVERDDNVFGFQVGARVRPHVDPDVVMHDLLEMCLHLRVRHGLRQPAELRGGGERCCRCRVLEQVALVDQPDVVGDERSAQHGHDGDRPGNVRGRAGARGAEESSDRCTLPHVSEYRSRSCRLPDEQRGMTPPRPPHSLPSGAAGVCPPFRSDGVRPGDRPDAPLRFPGCMLRSPGSSPSLTWVL